MASDKQKSPKSSDEWQVTSDEQNSPKSGARSPLSQVGRLAEGRGFSPVVERGLILGALAPEAMRLQGLKARSSLWLGAAGLKPRPSGVLIRRFHQPAKLATALFLGALLAAPVARADNTRKPTLEAIGNEVQCTCGCNAPLNQCPHLDCAEKAEMQAFIKKEIAEGKDETAILQDLSLRYGVQVLSAPPAHGFNLAVWILPSVGLLAGLGLVVVTVRRWKSKPAPAPAPASATHDPKVLTAIEEEMKSAGMG